MERVITELKPRNPDFIKRTNDSFNRQAFMKTLGVKLTDVKAGMVVMELDFNESLCQQHGFFHGGVIGTLVDNAGGYAAFSLMSAKDSVLSVEYKLNLMSPGDGDKLIAIGEVKKSGRRLTICNVDILIEKSGKRKLCATGLCTMMRMENHSDDIVTENILNND